MPLQTGCRTDGAGMPGGGNPQAVETAFRTPNIDSNTKRLLINNTKPLQYEDEKIYKGTIDDIEKQVSHISGVALILFGDYLNQKETEESHLYVKPLIKELKESKKNNE